MATILNYTPHEIVIVGSANEVLLRIPSSGSARCRSERHQVGEINGIALNTTVFGEISGLPEACDGVLLVVSRIVAEAATGTREDLIIVDDTVRDDEGRIIGARAFARI
jgi:hypothetical protein